MRSLKFAQKLMETDGENLAEIDSSAEAAQEFCAVRRVSENDWLVVTGT